MGKSSGGGSSTTTQQLDPTIKPYVQYALEQGKSQYQNSLGYKPYSGQTVAGFTPDTQKYFAGVRALSPNNADMIAASKQANAAGVGYLGSDANFDPTKFSGNQVAGADISKYMNPYLDDVVSKQMASMGQQRDEAAAALRTRQAGAGALGGSRAAVETVLANQKYNQTMADTEAELRMQGYDRATATALAQQAALNQAERDTEQSKQFGAGFEEAGAQNRAEYGLRKAAELGQLSEAERAQAMDQLNALKGIGTQQQLLQQAQLEDAYKRYIEQRDWQKNQLADYAAIAYGAPHGSTQTSRESSSFNPFSALGGLAMYGLGGGFSGLFRADGGVISLEQMMKDQKK
jgi:hypothetical protein